MRKVLPIVLMLLLFSTGSASACFKSSLDRGKWMIGYYKNPEPKKLYCSMVYYADKMQNRHENSWLASAEFYVAILEKDAALLNALYSSVDSNDSQLTKYLMLNILWLIDSDASLELLEKAKSKWGG